MSRKNIENYFLGGLEHSSVKYKEIFLPKFLIALWYSKGWKFMMDYHLEDPRSLENYIFWYVMSRKIEIKNHEIEARIFNRFTDLFHAYEVEEDIINYSLTPLQNIILEKRPDLNLKFQGKEKNLDFQKWWVAYGAEEYDVPKFPKFKNKIDISRIYVKELFIDSYERRGKLDDDFDLKSCIKKINEINSCEPLKEVIELNESKINNSTCVFGFYSSNNGIGEDARLIEKILLKKDGKIQQFDLNSCQKANDRHPSFLSYEPNEGDRQIFIAPIFEMHRAIFESKDLVSGGRKILITQWELENIDIDLVFIFNLFEKLFTISEFICNGLKKYDQRFEVLTLPFDTSSRIYGLPKYNSKLNYYFVYDENSFTSRKNPMDIIKAFQIAFKANEDVRLFIKASKFSLNNPDSISIVKAAKIDARIVLKEGYLNTCEYEEFIDAMHILISLHRAEGFGRVIGEALIMNKLVISSRYGGVMDYLSESNAILVDGVLGGIAENEYFCWKGNEWFYPDMQDAAAKIKFSYSNYIDFQKNLNNYKNRFEDKYSIKIIEKNKSYIYD